MELVDGVDVGEEQRHQVCRHGVLLDHGAAEPLREEPSAGPEGHSGCGHGAAVLTESSEDGSHATAVLLTGHQVSPMSQENHSG